jgi:hypothetical protein
MDMLGPLPALQAVAPEYADSIEDGTRAAEENLSATLRDTMRSIPVIPTLSLRYFW